MKVFKLSILLVAYILFIAGMSRAQAVDVSIPNAFAAQGNPILIPIEVGDLDGLGIISYQFVVTFDENVLDAIGVTSTGTLTESWGNPSCNTNIDGQVTVGGYNTTEISGGGTLVIINFDVQGDSGDVTDLSFSYFIFNDDSPMANITNGSVTVVHGYAEAITDLSITEEDGNSVRLSWSATNYAASYNIYRGTTPFFSPDTPLHNTSDLIYVDATTIGDPNTNYYYVVTAVNDLGESDISNRVGEFDYELITTSTTDFNEIALPLQLAGVNKASDLLVVIPNCNSVARWDASSQGYEQYVDWLPPTDFDVYLGYPYYVNVTSNSIFTLMGEYSDPTFNLITTSTTDFNEIMLPLDRIDITLASELLNDIPNCNSVARWDALSQGYEQYVDWLPPTNFNVKVGYPYYVNITEDTIWPEAQGKVLPTLDLVKKNINGHVQCSAPHLIYGKINLPSEIDISELYFTSYILSRQDECITDHSPGCKILADGLFWVQCASFPTSWQAGEIVRIEFHIANEEAVWQTFGATLTYDPADEAFLLMSRLDENLDKFETMQNYPNPFNAETVIKYKVPIGGQVRLSIYNLLGQKIRTLVNENLPAGIYQAVWDSKTDNMKEVSSGMYFCRLMLNDRQQIQRMILLQ